MALLPCIALDESFIGIAPIVWIWAAHGDVCEFRRERGFLPHHSACSLSVFAVLSIKSPHTSHMRSFSFNFSLAISASYWSSPKFNTSHSADITAGSRASLSACSSSAASGSYTLRAA